MSSPDQPTTAAEQRDAVQKEWSQYVALAPIYVKGARAFNAGDPVPASHVKNGVVRSDEVAKSSTKAAAAVTEQKG